MIQIDGTINLSLSINGVEFPLMGSFDSLQMNSSVQFSVPVMKIKFADPLALIGDLVELTDGSTIKISLGTSADNTSFYSFRSYAPKKELISNTVFYTVSGYLDVPKYFIDSDITFIKGTSSEVIQRIASLSGMSFFGSTTNDVQTWLNSNKRNCNFVKYIAKHGYSDNTSIMSLGVTLGKSVRYINFSEIDYTAEHVKEFKYGGGNGIDIFPIADYQIRETGGLYNILSGYRSKLIHQSIMDEAGIIDTIEIKPVADVTNLSQEIRNVVERGTVDYSMINSTNVHDNFFKARYQNARGSKLQNTVLKIMTQLKTPVELLDATNITLEGNVGLLKNQTTDVNYSGRYVITDKTIFVNSGNYSEVFNCVRDGLNIGG